MTEEKLRKACKLKVEIDELKKFLGEVGPNEGLKVINRGAFNTFMERVKILR